MGRLTALARARFLQNLAGTEKPHPRGHPLNRATTAVQPIAGREHEETGTEPHEHMHAQAVRMIATGAEAVEPHSDATGHRRTHAPERVEIEIGGVRQRAGEKIGRQHGRQWGRARTMAAIESFGVNGNLLRQSLRLGLSVLISIPLLRRLGLSRGLSTAAVITIMVLGMPGYSNTKGNAAQSKVDRLWSQLERATLQAFNPGEGRPGQSMALRVGKGCDAEGSCWKRPSPGSAQTRSTQISSVKELITLSNSPFTFGQRSSLVLVARV